MADLKKKKKKDASGSPNLVLVIFLIFFVIATIVLGIFTYSGISGQDEMKKELADAKDQAEVQKKMGYFFKMLYRDTRVAVGDEGMTEDEKKEFIEERKAFLAGTFKVGKKDDAAKTKADDDAKKLIDKFKTELGAKPDGYGSSLIKELEAARKDTEEWKAKANAAEAKVKHADDLSKQLLDDQRVANDKAFKRIVKDGADALAKVENVSDEFTKLAASNRVLSEQVKEKDKAIDDLKAEHQEALALKDKKIRDILADQKVNAEVKQLGGGVAAGEPGKLAPLLLDINMAKPLWDYPVGKIVRVDLQRRQVDINLGSKHGLKPETTFNIFGANPLGRPEKQMKGTIEVVKVLDSATSMCRITSLYDSEGKEILLNLDTRTRLARETESPVSEGDLLFNMFWGTRVAVLGYVSLTGEGSDNPAEQIRQMEDFMYLLNRNGMIVDAFVDPRDGQIKGNITARTRYVIMGSPLVAPVEKGAAAPPPPKEGEEKKDEPVKEKEPNKEGLANKERIDLINASSLELRKDAIDKGLLLISAENFANVIGYRKARAANSVEYSTFSPRLPYSGTLDTRVRPPRPEDAKKEKKEMEPKEGM